MDVSYLLHALRYVRNETHLPIGYQEAIEWLDNYIDTNWDTFDAILDAEREARTAVRQTGATSREQ